MDRAVESHAQLVHHLAARRGWHGLRGIPVRTHHVGAGVDELVGVVAMRNG
jgi:hypothetical protein